MCTFDTARVDAALQGTIFHGRLHHFATVDSTNTRALTDAHGGAEAGQVYIADEQTAGRGRGGHTWNSEPDRGLYLTALVRPRLVSNQVLKLSLAAAVAAYRAIREVTGVPIDLRWPNDLVVPQAHGPSRKLGGILTESASTTDGQVRHAAIGIGINLNQLAFGGDLQATATSLRLVTGNTISREAIAIALLTHLHGELVGLTVEDSHAQEDVFTRFAGISTWVYGKQVHVSEGAGYTGVTAGLTSDGLLRVQCDDGRGRIVRHGGVREL